MAITNNLLSQVDLPVWEWMRFAPTNTSATNVLTTSRDGSSKYLYFINGSQLYRYDTRADSWQTLSIGGSVTSLISAQYVTNQGSRGQVLSATSNTLQLPGLGNSRVGYSMKIVSGTGVGQERIITSESTEVVHDSGVATSASSSVLTDTTKKWKFNQWEGYGVRIMLNTGFGQVREVIYNDTTSLTVFDANYEGRDWSSNQYNGSYPYGTPTTSTGFVIISQVVTVDTPWDITPDSSSKYRIDSDGIWIVSSSSSSPYFTFFYYDILSDRWVTKLTPTGLISSSLATDITIAPITNLGGNFTLTGTNTTSSATTVTSQSITDSTLSLIPGCFNGCSLKIVSGLGQGQIRRITNNTDKTFTLSSKWDINPNTTSVYAVTPENSILLMGNGSSKMFKYYPERSLWTNGNILDNGVAFNMALIRPMISDTIQNHGVTSATRVLNGITAVSTTPTSGGLNYTVGDLLTISIGGSLGKVYVESISNIGAVLSVSLASAGSVYTTGTGKTTTGGTGAGCTINITSVGTIGVITTPFNHDFQIGDTVGFSGATETAWNTSITILGIQSLGIVETIITATANAVASFSSGVNLLVDVSQNWIPNEHAGKMLGVQSNGLTGTLTFKRIIGNSKTTISFISGVAPTNGNSRYFIQELEAFGDAETYLSDNQLSYGVASSASTVTSLVDATKNWNLSGVNNPWANNKMLITDGVGASMETIITSNTSNSLNIGRSVAVGAGTVNTIVYSNDNGVNWLSGGITTFTTSGNGICWSGTRFVAVGAGTNVIAYSNDGITWNNIAAATTTFSTAGNGVCWSGYRFVAVGEGTNSIAWSNDAVTWNVIVLGSGTFSTRGNAVAWSGIRFVAAGEGTNTLIYSTDGITWLVATNTVNTSVKAICWGETKFVAGGSGTNTVSTSSDGITWVAGTTPTLFTQINGIAWNGTRFVAVGNVSSGTNCIAYSTDGVTWTVPTTTVFTSGLGIAWNGLTFIATGIGTNTIQYSTDGITWSVSTTSTLFSTSGKGVASMSPFQSMTPNIGIIPNELCKYKIYDTSGIATGTHSTTTLQDLNKKWKVNQWVGSRIVYTSGVSNAIEGTIASNTSNTLTFGTTTTPDLTTTYTIIQKPVVSTGIQAFNNYNSSDTANKGRFIILPRGGASPTFDIYDTRTNRWKIGQYIQGMGEQLSTGTMYAYDGIDRIYYTVNNTTRVFYYDIVKNQINPFGTTPYSQGTVTISNKMEIVTTSDGLSYLYIMRHSGTEMWRTLIRY